jgi:hypothetical protein
MPEPDEQEEVPKNRGCKCGWPIDGCNPQFSKGQSCQKEKSDMEVQRFGVKARIITKANDAERDAAFYRRTADLIVVRER